MSWLLICLTHVSNITFKQKLLTIRCRAVSEIILCGLFYLQIIATCLTSGLSTYFIEFFLFQSPVPRTVTRSRGWRCPWILRVLLWWNPRRRSLTGYEPRGCWREALLPGLAERGAGPTQQSHPGDKVGFFGNYIC